MCVGAGRKGAFAATANKVGFEPLVRSEAAAVNGCSRTPRLDLRLAEVPQARPGDRIEIDGDAFLIQGEHARDRERLVWTVDLRPV